jgi:hypothetical protein
MGTAAAETGPVSFRALPQSHPWPAAILGDELDAGRLEGASQRLKSYAARLARATLETVDRVDTDSSFRREFSRIPAERRACHPALATGHFTAFLSLTPGPSPFSSTKITPADSRAATIFPTASAETRAP